MWQSWQSSSRDSKQDFSGLTNEIPDWTAQSDKSLLCWGGDAAWKCWRVVTTRLVRDEPSRPDCWKCRLVRDLEKTALVKAMAVFVEVTLLDVQERNSMAFVLDIHTKFRTLRETNLRAMPFEWTFYQEMLYQTSYVIFKYENPVEYQNLLWNVGETRPEKWRNLFMSVFVQASRNPLGYTVAWRLEKLQKLFVRLILRG